MKLRKIKGNIARGFFTILVPFLGAATAVQAGTDQSALVVTVSNAAKNQLLVYSPAGKLIQTLLTQGQGGAGGNAGGIQAKGNLVAVVNFGSQSVSIFEREGNGLEMKQLVPTVSGPVSGTEPSPTRQYTLRIGYPRRRCLRHHRTCR
ncbi:MAG: hypothetical protein LAQ69_15955 [Acidobacteriia bacterium]|nr:hypothetical protein [Terriglobia bacterium]